MPEHDDERGHPPAPPGVGWTRTEELGWEWDGPRGWVRARSQGNELVADSDHHSRSTKPQVRRWVEPDDIESVTIICTRASLANLARCQVIVRRKSRWRIWRERRFRADLSGRTEAPDA